MFESLSAWGWVAFAWAQLFIAYGGYLGYLRWREQRLLQEDEQLND